MYIILFFSRYAFLNFFLSFPGLFSGNIYNCVIETQNAWLFTGSIIKIKIKFSAQAAAKGMPS